VFKGLSNDLLKATVVLEIQYIFILATAKVTYSVQGLGYGLQQEIFSLCRNSVSVLEPMQLPIPQIPVFFVRGKAAEA
jgi:hypothetical protein